MTFEIAVVLLVVLLVLFFLYREILQPSLIFLIAVLIFYFTGILKTEELLSGLSNQSIVLIFILLINSDIIKRTGVMDSFIHRFLRHTLSYRAFLLRMTGMVSFISGWINNTPLVAFMIPYTYEWAKKSKHSASKVMLPLSYAAIMGGTLTLIGTSTNLVVNGLAVEIGLPSLKLFDFIYVGIPAVIISLLYINLIGHKILPERKDIISSFKEQTREYLVETLVPAKSNLIGMSVEKAHLRNLKGLYLAQIIRGNDIIAPVSPRETILEKDRLFFAGDTHTIIDLIEGNRNLQLPYGNTMMLEQESNIVEGVVTNNSRLINQTAKSSNFRKIFDAAIIAIQRNGEKLEGKIGEIKLKTGDLLLLVTGKKFSASSDNEHDFYVTSKIREVHGIRSWKKAVYFLGLLAAFLLSVFNILPLIIGLLILIVIVALMRMVKFSGISKSLDLNLLIILALAISMGKAITNSGLANLAAEKMLSVFQGNPFGIMVALYIITNITTMFVTNAAAVAIIFPIAFAAVSVLDGVSYVPYILTLAYAASAEYLTPFGYQTNLMVYGPGGYQFKDYLKFGFPLSIIYMVLTVSILGYIYHLY